MTEEEYKNLSALIRSEDQTNSELFMEIICGDLYSIKEITSFFKRYYKESNEYYQESKGADISIYRSKDFEIGHRISFENNPPLEDHFYPFSNFPNHIHVIKFSSNKSEENFKILLRNFFKNN